jgi:NADH-quinone oxidoreductase subunit M
MPVYSTLFLIVTLSSIALPLLNGFVGEFLVLIGTFTSTVLPHAKLFASLAAIGMILSAMYMLWVYQRVIYGEVTNPANQKLTDLSAREKLALAPLVALIFVMGIFPGLFLSRSDASIQAIKARFSQAVETAEKSSPAVWLVKKDRWTK